MKDRFSLVAEKYARFRPQYPQYLYDFILHYVKEKKQALDVGTGNGQVAMALSPYFEQVHAIDISAQQIAHAVLKPNVIYDVQPAEKTSFGHGQFDLVVCAQAVHWFKMDDFFAEIKRLLKPGGIIAFWGYGLIQTSGELNNVLSNFYGSLSNYWDKERRHIDERFANIPFPFTTIPTLAFSIEVQWTAAQLLGYLSTWSAIEAYIEKHGEDPVQQISATIHACWGNELDRDFSFPLFMKMGC